MLRSIVLMAATGIAAVSLATFAEAGSSGQSTMTIVDDSDEAREAPRVVRPAVRAAPAIRSAPAVQRAPVTRKTAPAERQALRSNAPDPVIRASFANRELYRAVVTRGIDQELKRLGCFRMGVGELHGTAFEIALEDYIRETGSYTYIDSPPSVLLSELIEQDSGLCFDNRSGAEKTARKTEIRRYQERVAQIANRPERRMEEVYDPERPVQRKVPRIRIYW